MSPEQKCKQDFTPQNKSSFSQSKQSSKAFTIQKEQEGNSTSFMHQVDMEQNFPHKRIPPTD
jgi:hypothetical protein